MTDQEWTESLAALAATYDDLTQQIAENRTARQHIEDSIRELMEANGCTKREAGGYIARLAPEYRLEPNANLTAIEQVEALGRLPITRAQADKAAKLEVKWSKRGVGELYDMGGQVAEQVARIVARIDQPSWVEIKKAKRAEVSSYAGSDD